MKIRRIYILLPLLLGCFNLAFSQKQVLIFTENEEIVAAAAHASLQRKCRSPRLLNNRLAHWRRLCHDQGYLAFSVDSVAETETAYQVFVFEGPKTVAPAAKVSSQTQFAVAEAGLSAMLKNGTLPLADFDAFAEKMLAYLENSGYPFAEIYLDSADIQKEGLSAVLRVEKHERIVLDSVITKGTARLRLSYLYPYLGLRRDKPYCEKRLHRVAQKVSELTFATATQPPAVEFVNDKARLYLFLDKRKSSRFDGYVALVPQDKRSGRFGIAGELNLDLKNLFAVGETFSLQWRAPSWQSQYLKAEVEFPFLFYSPWGVGADFLLDKTDTTYLTMSYNVGVRYSILGNGYLKATFGYNTSDILNPELVALREAASILADYRKMNYGLQFHYQKLDYVLNPRKGFEMNLLGKISVRSILKNASLDEDAYKGMDLKTTCGFLTMEVAGYVPLHRRWVLKLEARGGGLLGKGNLSNDLFKLGGLNSLRGFGEDEILASSWGIAAVELRFLLAKIAYLNAFFNAAYYERSLPNLFVHDWPYGFGVGVAFDTRAGLFFMDYALGRQFDNPISFKTGKIHFGLKLNF